MPCPFKIQFYTYCLRICLTAYWACSYCLHCFLWLQHPEVYYLQSKNILYFDSWLWIAGFQNVLSKLSFVKYLVWYSYWRASVDKLREPPTAWKNLQHHLPSPFSIFYARAFSVLKKICLSFVHLSSSLCLPINFNFGTVYWLFRERIVLLSNNSNNNALLLLILLLLFYTVLFICIACVRACCLRCQY